MLTDEGNLLSRTQRKNGCSFSSNVSHTGFFLFLGGVVISPDMLHANPVFCSFCLVPHHCDLMYRDRRYVALALVITSPLPVSHIQRISGRYWPRSLQCKAHEPAYTIATVFYLVIYMVTHVLKHVFQICCWAEEHHVNPTAPPGVDPEFPRHVVYSATQRSLDTSGNMAVELYWHSTYCIDWPKMFIVSPPKLTQSVRHSVTFHILSVKASY